MGSFHSAARDPIFYAHHSNIDRLWGVWKELRNNVPEIVDPDWLDSYFYFHNEKSQLVRIKIRGILNITKLRYRYEQIDHPWLNAQPKPSMDPTFARHALNAGQYFYCQESTEFAGTYVSLPKGITLVLNEGDAKKKSKSTIKLGISELLDGLQANEEESIWV
ncbi:Polyphenol oxidase protein, partial [Thalictrum thalictroides]